MDVLSQTSIKVIDSTIHYNTENMWKVSYYVIPRAPIGPVGKNVVSDPPF